jgi:hypothetical protein
VRKVQRRSIERVAIQSSSVVESRRSRD